MPILEGKSVLEVTTNSCCLLLPPMETSLHIYFHLRSITSTLVSAAHERSIGRTKPREEGSIRWNELLEKFKNVQERSRRSQRLSQRQFDQDTNGTGLKQSVLTAALSAAATADQPGLKGRALPDVSRGGIGGVGLGISGSAGRGTPTSEIPGPRTATSTPTPGHKSKGLGNFSRLGIGGRKSRH
jgi:vacuole morphology and inheritance protein 14